MPNDYQTLVNYIRALIPTLHVNVGESLRDLGNYFDIKYADPDNVRRDVGKMAKRALKAAGLEESRTSPNLSALDQPANHHKRACAATLLAMSIIRDTEKNDLERNLQRLSRMQTAAVVSELRSILTKGDTVRSLRFPKLEFKNFTSAGTRARVWKFNTEEAFRRVHEILGDCERQFLFSPNPLAGKIDGAFRHYFGDPAAFIDTSTILFQPGGGPPAWAPPNQTHLTVVKEVMRRVCRNFVNQSVRIYFGGKGIDRGTNAYVSGATNPTKIHLGGAFFEMNTHGLESMPGTIIHECTHTFARTDDHRYESPACRALVPGSVDEALSNADSYMFFAEEAFG